MKYVRECDFCGRIEKVEIQDKGATVTHLEGTLLSVLGRNRHGDVIRACPECSDSMKNSQNKEVDTSQKA